MNPANPRLLTINVGSSSIRFALYEVGADRVKVQVIRTDEELMIARSVTRVLNLHPIRDT
jgi:acetate kinase